jgi:hypothetical protein
MPMSEGAEWTYSVEMDKGMKRTIKVAADQKAPVEDTEGWILTSELGESLAAWQGRSLVFVRLAGTEYTPPITLLDLKLDSDEDIKWSGEVAWAGKTLTAEGLLTQKSEKIQTSVGRIQTLRSNLQLTFEDGNRLGLITWFARGRGIVRQQQRISASPTAPLDAASPMPSISYISGP